MMAMLVTLEKLMGALERQGFLREMEVFPRTFMNFSKRELVFNSLQMRQRVTEGPWLYMLKKHLRTTVSVPIVGDDISGVVKL
jgi:hypothetical protein